MSGRPPRAGTRSEGKRARTRGATQSDRTAGRTGQRAVPRANERASERSIERPSDPGGERTSDRAIDLALDKLERRSRPPASEPVGRSRPGPPGPIDPVDLIEVVVEGEHGEQDRAPSVGTDQFVRVADDAVVEVTDLAEPPQLRLLVLEAAPQLAAAAAAIAAAGHVVVAGASGATGVERLRAEVGGVDALLVGLPGGEPLIDAALSLGAARPVVIASSAGSALDAVRRATGSGADLATVRPHEIERLAPVLLAAARLVEQRRGIDPAATAPDLARGAALPELRDLREPRDLAGTGEALGGTGHPESGAALGGAGLVAPGAALEGAELEDPGAALE
ncbi:MAG TPA: hypothetical protein VFK02_07345, partial [Kofleriaceae bacterium]|nr:hypothetical protein [Kofleriaceae bacterium]